MHVCTEQWGTLKSAQCGISGSPEADRSCLLIVGTEVLHIHPEPNVVRHSWGISGWSPWWLYLLFAASFKADLREPVVVVAANQEPRLACPSCESVNGPKPKLEIYLNPNPKP